MLLSVGANYGPLILDFVAGTICPEVADDFSGSTNSERYEQHYSYVPTTDASSIRSAKRKGKRQVEADEQELNVENVLLKRQRQELSIRMLQLEYRMVGLDL